jgi:spore germination protein
MYKKLKHRILSPCITLCFVLTLTGCWDAMPFGEISFNLELGLESSKDKKLMVTRSSPVFEERIQDKTETFIVDADSVRESREETKKLSPNLTVGGKLQHVLFSKELAQKGIGEYLEIFERDPTVPNQCLVVVVNGSPKEFLQAAEAFRDKPSPGYYMNRLLENNIKSSHIPSTEVYRFNINYFTPGMDPIVPMVELAKDDNDAIRVMGCALFKDDKMVGELDTKRTFLLLAMMKDMGSNQYSFSITNPEENEDTDIVMSIMLKQPKVKINININDKNSAPKVALTLDFTGSIDEYKWNNLAEAKFQKEVENNIAEKLKSECERVLKYTQEVESDPIGIGNLVRARHNSYWKSIKWEDIYKDIAFNVTVHVAINQYGITK